MVSNSGPAAVDLDIDAVRGTDVAKITHSLSDKTLNGWQWNASDRTPLNAVTGISIWPTGLRVRIVSLCPGRSYKCREPELSINQRKPCR